MASNPKPTYSIEEVKEILRRALDEQVRRGERALGHDELVDMAAEIGIDREALDAATVQLAQERSTEVARRSEENELAAERRVQTRRFASSAMTLGILNTALYFIDMHVSGGTWFFWPALGSGAMLALQLKNVLFPDDKLRKRKRREQRLAERARRRAEREQWKRRFFEGGVAVADGARAFESAVQQGVTALLHAATRKLEEHTGQRDPRRR